MLEKYPTSQVIIMYGIYGSVIGTLIGSLIVTICTLGLALWVIPAIFIQCLLLGFIPAMTTGVILALRKETLEDNSRSSWIFSAGYFVTVIYSAGFFIYKSVIYGNPTSLETIVFYSIIAGLACGFIGGLASIFTAKAVLPNSSKEIEK